MSQASLRISGYFSTPQGTLFPFALSPTHRVDLPPSSVVVCISCSLYFAHSCHVWFASYYPTLLRTGRSVPSSRPHHASGPLTLNPGHVLTRPSRSRTRITSPQWPAGYALHHGPESRSAAHVTAPTTPLMVTVTVTPGLVAVTSPPRPGPHTLPTTPTQPMESRHQAHGCSLTTPPARMSAAARPGSDPYRSTQLPAPTRPARPDPAHDEGTPPPLPLYSRPGS